MVMRAVICPGPISPSVKSQSSQQLCEQVTSAPSVQVDMTCRSVYARRSLSLVLKIWGLRAASSVGLVRWAGARL